MRTFHVSSFGAAVILSALLMGVLGAFVVIPVACIQWTWNSVATHIFLLPAIGAGQAILLYLFCVCLTYVLGLVHIEIKTETLER